MLMEVAEVAIPLRIQFFPAIIWHKRILLGIECEDLGNALIYNYDGNSSAKGFHF